MIIDKMKSLSVVFTIAYVCAILHTAISNPAVGPVFGSSVKNSNRNPAENAIDDSVLERGEDAVSVTTLEQKDGDGSSLQSFLNDLVDSMDRELEQEANASSLLRQQANNRVRFSRQRAGNTTLPLSRKKRQAGYGSSNSQQLLGQLVQSVGHYGGEAYGEHGYGNNDYGNNGNSYGHSRGYGHSGNSYGNYGNSYGYNGNSYGNSGSNYGDSRTSYGNGYGGYAYDTNPQYAYDVPSGVSQGYSPSSTPMVSFVKSFKPGKTYVDKGHVVRNYYRHGDYEVALQHYRLIPRVEVVPYTTHHKIPYQDTVETTHEYKAYVCKECYHGYPKIDVYEDNKPNSYVVRRFVYLPNSYDLGSYGQQGGNYGNSYGLGGYGQQGGNYGNDAGYGHDGYGDPYSNAGSHGYGDSYGHTGSNYGYDNNGGYGNQHNGNNGVGYGQVNGGHGNGGYGYGQDSYGYGNSGYGYSEPDYGYGHVNYGNTGNGYVNSGNSYGNTGYSNTGYDNAGYGYSDPSYGYDQNNYGNTGNGYGNDGYGDSQQSYGYGQESYGYGYTGNGYGNGGYSSGPYGNGY